MAETGNQVFEGSSARAEKKLPRVVERVKQKIEAFRAGVQQEVDARKAFGQEIQARTMDRYARVVGSMNESMLKSAYKKIEPVVKLQATAKGVAAGALDTSLGMVFRTLRTGLGFFTGVKIMDAASTYKLPGFGRKVGEAVGAGAATYGADVASRRFANTRPAEALLRFHENAKDYVGKKQVEVLNKIIGRKKAPAPASV